MPGPTRMRILRLLVEENRPWDNPISFGEIAQRLGLTPRQVFDLVKKMEATNLVQQAEIGGIENGTVEITDDGRRALDAFSRGYR
ncbi:MAG: winged helix-turn-helix domain-containing protein [Desulfarculus sp.]|nr:winged helix-turn-helix domain-containing protein [Desulfarculus sp.]